MAEIIKKYDDTYIFEEDGVRFFLLIGNNMAILLDSGMNSNDALMRAKELTDKEIILVNTHCDIDHISANQAFTKVYMSIHEIRHYLEYGYNQEIIPLYHGDIIDLGNRELEIIDLPGHTSGSIALLDKKYRILFSGDSIQRNGRIFMFGKERNMYQYHLSLIDLKKRENDFDEIWPCHNEIPINKDMIDSLIIDSKKALNNELDINEAEFHGNKIKVLKGTNNIFLVD